MDHGSEHDKMAWHKVNNISDVRQAESNLARAMLNPHNHSCWGFKEILYARGKNCATFSHNLNFFTV
jgi:hypothetical protein